MGCTCDSSTRTFFKVGWLPLYSESCGFEDGFSFCNWASSHYNIMKTCDRPLLGFIVQLLLLLLLLILLLLPNSLLGIP